MSAGEGAVGACEREVERWRVRAGEGAARARVQARLSTRLGQGRVTGRGGAFLDSIRTRGSIFDAAALLFNNGLAT